MTVNRRDREHRECERCGKQVTIRRGGELMAHASGLTGRSCVPAKWQTRQAAAREAAAGRHLAALVPLPFPPAES